MDDLLTELNQLVPEVVSPIFSRASVQQALTVETKADGSLITSVDEDIQLSLLKALKRLLPNSEVLAEEQSPKEHRKALQSHVGKLWLVDPLDGTTNFSGQVPYYAVSVGLLDKGELTHALVFDPVRQECFVALKDCGAWLNDQPLDILNRRTPEKLSECIAIVDFKRLDKDLACRLAVEPPYRSQRSFGAVALDWCWLAAGRGHLYLHGKQQIWDYAAGYLIASESGVSGIQLGGEQIGFDEVGPIKVIAAGTPRLFALWQEWLQC